MTWARKEAERIVGDAVVRAFKDVAHGEMVKATYPPGSFAYQAADLGIRLAEVRAALWNSPVLRGLAWLLARSSRRG